MGVEETVFPKAFSPFAVKRCSMIRHALAFVSRIIVNVNVGRGGGACFPVRGHIRVVHGFCGSRPQVGIRSCSYLAVSFTHRMSTRFVIHNVHAIGSFRCRRAVTSVGQGLTNVRAVLLFARPRLAYIDSAVIHRLLNCGGSVDVFVPGKVRVWWARIVVGGVVCLLVNLYSILKLRTRGFNSPTVQGLRLTRFTVSGLCMSAIGRGGLIRSTVVRVLTRLSPRSACSSTRRIGGVGRPLRNGFRKVNMRFRVVRSALLVMRPIDGNPSRGMNVLTKSHVVTIGSATVTNMGVKARRVVKHLQNPGSSGMGLAVVHENIGRPLLFGMGQSGVPVLDLSTTCVVRPGVKCVHVGHFKTAATRRFLGTLGRLRGGKVGSLVLSLRNGKKNCLGTTVSLTGRFLKRGRLVICARKHSTRHDRFFTGNGKGFHGKHLIMLMSRCSTSTDRVIANTVRS